MFRDNLITAFRTFSNYFDFFEDKGIRQKLEQTDRQAKYLLYIDKMITANKAVNIKPLHELGICRNLLKLGFCCGFISTDEDLGDVD